MKTIQCVSLLIVTTRHHCDNMPGWETAIWRINALLVLNQQSAQQAQGEVRIYINKNRNWFTTHRVLNEHMARSVNIVRS